MWKYFDKCDNGGLCKLCRMMVKTCGNTTNLKQHLKRKHSSININVSASACKSANDEDDPSIVQFWQSGTQTQTTLDTVVMSHSRPTSQCSGYESVLSKNSELSDSVSDVSVVSNFTKLMQPTIDQSFNEIRSFESKI